MAEIIQLSFRLGSNFDDPVNWRDPAGGGIVSRKTSKQWPIFSWLNTLKIVMDFPPRTLAYGWQLSREVIIEITHQISMRSMQQ